MFGLVFNSNEQTGRQTIAYLFAIYIIIIITIINTTACRRRNYIIAVPCAVDSEVPLHFWNFNSFSFAPEVHVFCVSPRWKHYMDPRGGVLYFTRPRPLIPSLPLSVPLRVASLIPVRRRRWHANEMKSDKFSDLFSYKRLSPPELLLLYKRRLRFRSVVLLHSFYPHVESLFVGMRRGSLNIDIYFFRTRFKMNFYFFFQSRFFFYLLALNYNEHAD